MFGKMESTYTKGLLSMILGSYENTRRKLVIQSEENIHIQLLAFKSIFYVIILCRLEPFWQLNVNTVCF